MTPSRHLWTAWLLNGISYGPLLLGGSKGPSNGPMGPPKRHFFFWKKNSSKRIFCSIFVNFWAFGPNFWQMSYFLNSKLSSRFTQIGPGTPSGGYSTNPAPQIGLNWVYALLGEIISNCFSFWLILQRFSSLPKPRSEPTQVLPKPCPA